MNFTDADPSKLLDQLSPDAYAQGIVNIIDVAAIRQHDPARWERRAEQVEDYIQRAFRKRARTTDMLIRLSDTQFITIQPGATRAVAIACCGHVAKETFGYFLGAGVPAAIRILVASGLGADGIAAAEIAPEDILAAMNSAPAELSDRKSPGPLSDWKLGKSQRFIVQVSPRIEASLTLEPIWHSFHGAIASFLVQPTIFEEVGGSIVPVKLTELGPRNAGVVTAQIIDFAAEVLRQAKADGVRFGLHLPVPLDALTPSRERLIVRDHFRALLGDFAQLVVVELCDCPDGMPQSRMIDLVNSVRPFCRAAIARTTGDAPPLPRWREAGLSGIAIVFDGASERSSQAEIKRIQKLADALVGPRTLIVGHAMRKRELVLAAWAGGFTHVSGAVIADLVQVEGRPVRLSATEIFAA